MMSLFKNYDKLILGAVVLGLLASAAVLVKNMQSRADGAETFDNRLAAMTPDHPVAEPLKMAPYEETLRQLRSPRHIKMPQDDQAGFFIPETRVWCPGAGCHKPIVPEGVVRADGTKECPVCGIELSAPVEDPEADYDKDGMSNGWERKYNFDPWDPSDAAKDADNDGFTNLEEFKAGTDPRDPQSHPPYEGKLELTAIDSKPVGLILQTASLMPDESYRCQISDGKRSYFVRTSDERRGRDDEAFLKDYGYKAVSFEKLSEEQETATMSKRNVDVSILTLERAADGTRIPLRMRQTDAAEEMATLRMPIDDQTWTLAKGATFTFRGSEFQLIEIDSRAQSVVIGNKATGNRLTIKR